MENLLILFLTIKVNCLIEMKILAMPEAQRQKEMNKEYIKDLNMIFQDKMRQKLIDYRTEKSLDKELGNIIYND